MDVDADGYGRNWLLDASQRKANIARPLRVILPAIIGLLNGEPMNHYQGHRPLDLSIQFGRSFFVLNMTIVMHSGRRYSRLWNI